ncbi:MAG: AAA family ATPase [Actinomycetota bacterium]|nr:AAA family ATPase [Actinomycetota bacterium]
MDFVGRDSELDQLVTALDSASDGNGRFVVIRGEAGIGKTELLNSFCDGRGTSIDVLFGTCEDLTTPRPFQPLYAIANDAPEIRESLQAADTFAVARALLSRLNGRGASTVVVIDDAHWADQATLEVLKYVGRRIADTRGLLVVLIRDEDTPVEHPLRNVVASVPPASAVRIALQPLDLASVQAVAGEHDAGELYALTGGNPLLLGEYLQSDSAVPLPIEDLVLARLNTLSPSARSIAEFVSVSPGSCEQALLDVSLNVAPGDLDECEQSGLLVIDAIQLAFRHELTRRAVEQSLGSGTRIALNGGIARELESANADVARILHHAIQAGNTDAIARLSPQAVQRAVASRSYREAIQHLQDLQPYLERLDPLTRAAMLEQWADATSATGDVAKSLETRTAAVEAYREHGTAVQLGRCMRPLALLYWRMKQPEAAKASAEEAVAVLQGDRANCAEYALALADQAFVFAMHGEHAEGLAVLDVAIAATTDIDDPGLAAQLLAVQSWNVSSDRDAEVARRAIALGEQAGSITAVRTATPILIYRSSELPQTERDTVLSEALTFAQDHGLDDVAAFAYIQKSHAYWRSGDFAAAEDEARFAAQIWDDLSQNLAVFPLLAIGLNQARRGSPQMLSTLANVFDAAAVGGGRTTRGANPALAEAYWLHGNTPFDPDRSIAELRAVFDDSFPGPGDAWAWVWMWKLGLVSTISDLEGTREGLLVSGDWRGAASAWDAPGTLYMRAVALSHGDTEAKIEALALLDEMDAEPMRRRIHRDLREAGVKNIPSGPRSATRDHPAGLTSRQADVMDLLEQGLTNREIADRLYVSSRTVEHHVAAILSKLGASSRAEAVAIAGNAKPMTR